MKGYIITWAASVLSASIIGAAWNYTHPSPRMVSVSMTDVIAEHTKMLEGKIKPGMSDDEKKAVFQLASDYGKHVDEALTTVARECGCAVLNKEAIVRIADGAETGIPDMTWRVKELLTGGK